VPAVDGFHDEIDTQGNEGQMPECEEMCQNGHRSEGRDRNFVRRALHRGVPAQDIEDRLLIATQFHRLNPERDPVAYVRGLIDEEGSSFRDADLTDPRAAHSRATANNSVADAHAVREKCALESEAIARRYIQENFEAAEWLAVVVRNRQTGETVQRVTTAEQIASHEFQSWLRYKNAHGSDIYLSLNTLREHASGRTKNDVKDIRHLYLDLDEEGQRKLAAIYQDAAVPQPNYVLQTSPEKYQVVWRVEGIPQNDAEGLLRGLARRFGGDRAATDSTRVFRLPGFNNKKYEQNFPVKLAPGTQPEPIYHPSDFRIEPISSEPGTAARTNIRAATELSSESANTQSERDWAYAIRHLRHGDNPEDVVREIAAYRTSDRYDSQETSRVVSSSKPKPRYYAEHTVSRAMAHLGMTSPSGANESRSPESEPDR
jgi:RepB DNA-primase from phage plasmid